ncbi:MAG: hypothetical protein EOP39_13260 [Rubrivivax sp.]|nr:MAG: hypothetical protein EOP39_13260 [Rubrivivax sp.]
MGDVLLASSVLQWLQGGRLKGWRAVAAMAVTPLLAALLMYILLWLGVTPQRGPVWLVLQLALVVPATIAAIRRWSDRDLNEMD